MGESSEHVIQGSLPLKVTAGPRCARPLALRSTASGPPCLSSLNQGQRTYALASGYAAPSLASLLAASASVILLILPRCSACEAGVWCDHAACRPAAIPPRRCTFTCSYGMLSLSTRSKSYGIRSRVTQQEKYEKFVRETLMARVRSSSALLPSRGTSVPQLYAGLAVRVPRRF